MRLGVAVMLGNEKADKALTEITAQVLVDHHTALTDETKARYEAVLQAQLLALHKVAQPGQ